MNYIILALLYFTRTPNKNMTSAIFYDPGHNECGNFRSLLIKVITCYQLVELMNLVKTIINLQDSCNFIYIAGCTNKRY